MTTYAGEVRIKTRLDAEGINKGMKAVSAQLGGIVKAIGTGTAIAAASVVAIVAAIGAGLVKAFKEMSKMDGFKDQLAGLNLALANLKNAAYSAILPIFNALLPIIMRVVDWLTRAANVAAAFFAALTGASTYMVYVADSLGGAAGSSGDYADNMERAERAAKGATASFDKLNVLQQEKTPDAGGGGGGGSGHWVIRDVEDTLGQLTGGWGAFVDGLIKAFKDGDWSGLKQWFTDYVWNPWIQGMKDRYKKADDDVYKWSTETGKKISDWYKKADDDVYKWSTETGKKIKEKATEIWEGIKDGLGLIWDDIKRDIVGAWDSVKEKWEEAKQFFIDLWAGIKEGAIEKWDEIKLKVTEVWDSIKEKWQEAKTWFDENVLIPIKTYFTEKWDEIKLKVTKIWDDVKEKWQEAKTWFDEKVLTPIKNFFTEKWDEISLKVTGVWDDIKGVWQTVSTWFEDEVITPISKKFDEMWDDISTWASDTWEDIKNTIKDAINHIIKFVNNLIGAMELGINGIIEKLNTLSFTNPFNKEETWGINIKPIYIKRIPYLATGAVIPPNAPFAAILGDQKSGRNIEAPEGLLRQIIQDELRGMNSQPQTIHNVLKLDGRVVYESWDRESRRIGGSMVTKAGAA